MKVMKLTTVTGAVYYNADYSPALIAEMLESCRNMERIELVEMTPKEYLAIPATSDAARLFESEVTK